MKKLIISAAALLTLVACGQQNEEATVAEQPKAPVSGIDTAGMDTNVRPGDDFFAYMNGTWVAETEIPADKARYGTFDVLRDESQEAVKLIIEESAGGDFAANSAQRDRSAAHGPSFGSASSPCAKQASACVQSPSLYKAMPSA